jgi:arsenite methyltransferase
VASDILEHVRSKYGAAARSGLSGDQAGVRAIAEAFGYAAEELEALPAGANLGLSCGNPTAFARLRPGEVVADLGCGGGIDVLLAALKVGPSGRAIGIDMTEAMIKRARANACQPVQGQILTNVEFHVATIDQLPLADASVDCLVSNCVINLAPDKGAVFREMARVLRPGGRVALSDIALKNPLPVELGQSLAAYIGCVAGALLIEDYAAGLRAAGFHAVQTVDAGKDLNVYALVEGQAACCSPAMTAETPFPMVEENCSPAPAMSSSVHGDLADLLRRYDINEFAASVYVYALKPLEKSES